MNFRIPSEIITKPKHCQAIGKAMPLYLYLLFYKDRNMRVDTKHEELSDHFGVNRRTIQRWIFD